MTAGDLVFVGDESGALRALEAADGKPRWQSYTAGAIFFAPALWQGRAYVGSADGRIYAFEAATGRRLWTFRAAPADRWIPVLGKLISTWPVAGGVLVEDGVLYAAAGIVHYDGTHVYALDAVTGKVKWHNDSSGTLSDRVKNGISLQGGLAVQQGTLRFFGGSVYRTASYDLATGKCLTEPVHVVGSHAGGAFYPYYPQYGQFLPLSHTLADGRTLNYAVDTLWSSRHSKLAMLQPGKPGAADAPTGWTRDGKRAGLLRPAVWECKSPRRFNSFIVAPNLLLAAGQADAAAENAAFLAAVNLRDGSERWQEKLAAPVVRGGTAVDHAGRVFAAQDDGCIVGFEPVR